MQRVDIIMDMEPDYLFEEENHRLKKPRRNSEKTIKITDELFDIAVREGLIEKTDDGYVFIGKYDEIKEFRKKKKK